jgi:uncharacterized delta-60 repeat protein
MPKRRHHKGRASVEAVERRILLAGNLDPTFASAGVSVSDYPDNATAAAIVPTVNKFFVLLGNSTVGKTVLEQTIVASFFRPDGKLDTGSDANATPERVIIDLEPSANETVIASAALANGDVVIAGTINNQAMVAVLRPTNLGDPDKQRGFSVVATRFFGVPNASTTAATDVIVDSGGRVVVVGVANIAAGASRQVFAARFTSGTLTPDNTFGTAGASIFYTATGGVADTARVAEVGTTASLSIAWTDYTSTKTGASSVRGRRLEPNGAVDAKFAFNYTVSGTVVQPTRLGDVIADGTGLTIAGEFGAVTSTPAGFAARFSDTGVVVNQATSLGNLNSVTSLARQADGKLIAAGFDSQGPGEPSFVSVSRLQSNLAVDNSYGGTNSGNIVLSGLTGKAQGVMIDTSTGRAVLAADDIVTGQDLALVGLTPDLPDFFASSFGVQGTLTLGQSFNTTVTVFSNRSLPTPATTVRYTLTRASTGFSLVVGEATVPALAGNSNTNISASFTLPGGIAAGTGYTLTAFVDPDNQVNEENESPTDNGTSASVTIAGSDLQASTFGVGGTITLGTPFQPSSLLIFNNATPTTTAFNVRYDLMRGAVFITTLATETTPALGAFANRTLQPTLSIPAGTPGGSYQLRATLDSGDLVPEVNETNNTATTASFTVIGPNLTISSFTPPASAAPGGQFNAPITITNNGSAAAEASSVRITLFGSPTTVLGTFGVPAIAAGGSASINPSVTIPANSPLGSFTLTATVDPSSTVAELNESDNNAPRAFSVQAADLTPTLLTAAATVFPGNTLPISSTISNLGNISSTATVVRLSLVGATTVQLGDFALATIAAGGNGSINPTVTIPANTPLGSYSLTAVVDPDNTVTEANEGNNTITRTVIVQAADLAAGTLSTPTATTPGALLSVTFGVSNIGNLAAAANTVRFELVNTSTSAVTALGDVALGGLAAAASTSLTPSFTVPAITPLGNYNLRATIDPAAQVSESNEANNQSIAAIFVSGVNLTPTAITAANTVFPGNTLPTSITVANTGNIASAATTVRVTLVGSSTVDLGSFALAAIGAGGSATITPTLTIPAGTALAAYTLTATVDPAGTVAEINETDNAISRALTVQAADLGITAFNTSAGGVVGSTVNFSATIQNLGNVNSVAGQYALSLSGPGGTFPLGSFALPAIGQQSSSGVLNGSFVVPQAALGAYTITLTADSTGTTPESNEANNTATASFTVQQVDLSPTVITAAAAVGIGNNLAVSVTIANLGNIASSASTVNLSLLGQSTLDLGTFAVPAIAAGGSTTLNLTPLIPANTARGFYSLAASVDPNESLAEANEGNNTILRNLTVQAADLRPVILALPSSVDTGASLSFTVRVSNQGDAPSSAGLTRFSLVNRTTGAAVSLGSEAVAAIAAGGSNETSPSFNVPVNTPPGLYDLVVTTDTNNETLEFDENNNSASQGIFVQAVNLSAIGLIAPADAAPGSTLPLSLTVLNLGGAAAPASTLTILLSSTTGGGEVTLVSIQIPALASGGFVDLNPSVTIPAQTAFGSYELRAVADSGSAVIESNEADNVSVSPLVVGVRNLTVTQVSVPPILKPGQSLTASVTVKNDGSLSTSATTMLVKASLDADTSTSIQNQVLIPQLAPGASATINVPLLPNPQTLGSYTVAATADVFGAIAESNETDNTTTATFVVGFSDFGQVSIVPPARFGLPGSVVPIPISITNNGNLPTAASSIKLELFPTQDAPNIQLGTFVVPSIPANTTITISPIVNVPMGSLLGRYVLTATVDPSNTVDEQNEANNVASRDFFVGAPDITVEPISTNLSSRPGDQAVFVFNLINEGSAPAVSVTYTLRLTGNGFDAVVATDTSSNLLAGVVDDQVILYTIPDIVPGSYELTLTADPDNTIQEPDEANNSLTLPIQILGPNLAFGDFAPPSQANPGTTIELQIPVQNIGTDISSATVVRVELKGATTTLFSEDLPFSGRDPSEGVITLFSSIAIPTSAALGDYQLIVTINPNNNIPNESTVDNVFTSTIEVVAADLELVSLSVPASQALKQSIPVSITVRNNSTLASAATTAHIALTPSTGSAILLGNLAVPSIEPGAQITLNTNYAFNPAGVSLGTATIAATLDLDNAIVESNELNNTATAQSNIVSAQLEFVGGLVAPSTPIFPGDNFPVSFTLRNSGNLASVATQAQFSFFGSAPILVDVPAIAAGATVTINASLASAANNSPFPITLTLTLDPQGSIPVVSPASPISTDIIIGSFDLSAQQPRINGLANSPTLTQPIGPVTVASVIDTPTLSAGLTIPVRFEIRTTGQTTRTLLGNTTVVGSTNPGGVTASVTTALPAGITPGNYEIIVTVDPDNTLRESNELNNQSINSLTIRPAPTIDLVPAIVSVVPGAAPSITFTISNSGNTSQAGSTFTRFLLATSANPTPAEIAAATELGRVETPGVNSGSSITIERFVSFPDGLPLGQYFIVIQADGTGVVSESAENNNTVVAGPFTAGSLPPTIDLAPSVTTYSAISGVIRVAGSITNSGNAAAAASTARIVLTTTATPTAQQIAAGIQLGTFAVSTLQAGGQFFFDQNIPLPAGTPTAAYFAIVIADSAAAITETSETNNTAASSFSLSFGSPGQAATPADLTAIFSSVTANGPTVKVIGELINVGETAAVANQARVVLVTSRTASDTEIAAGIQLGVINLPAIAGGSRTAFEATLSVPANTPTVAYFVVLILDVNNSVPESGELNNTTISSTSVVTGSEATQGPTPPDLTSTVSSFTASGQAVSLIGEVINGGESAAAATSGRVVLVRSASPSAFDINTGVQLGTFDLPALAGGARSAFNLTLNLPPNTATAAYFAVIIVDNTGIISESSEANNTTVTTNAVVTGSISQAENIADLVPSNVSATGTVTAGNSLPVSFTVTNSGLLDAGTFTASIYLFSSPTFDVSTAVLLGTTDIASLAVNAATNVQLSLTVPGTTPLGTYAVAVVVDSGAVIAETSETNNTATTAAASVTVQERPLGQVENDIGQPDRNFGSSNGIVTTIIPGIPFVVVDTRVDSLGRQLAAGSADNGDIVVVRLLASGQIDTSYATGGVLRLATASPTIVSAIHLYADGSVLIAGYTNTAAANTPPVLSAVLARITPAGQADVSFGPGGVLTPVLPGATSKISAMVVAGDGSVYIGLDGSRLGVVKLAGDGSVMPAFADAGLFSLSDAALTRSGVPTSRGASVAALAVDPANGDLVIAGNFTDEAGNDAGAILARVSSAGVLNAKFAKGRLLAPVPASGIARADTLAIQGKGLIILAGSVRDAQVNASRADLFVIRTDARGNQDRRFGTRGVFVQSAPSASPFLSASRIVPLADGRIVISAKVARSLANADLKLVGSAIIRLTARGQADTGFGTGGFSLIFSPDTVVTAAAVGDLQSEFTDFILSNQGLIALTPGGGILALASRATGDNETTIAVTSVVSDGIDLIAIGTVKLTAPVNGAVVGGTRAQVSLTVTNDGTLRANGTSTVALYLSDNSILGVDDVRIASAPLKLSNLKPGAKRKLALRVNLPTTGFEDGTYNLFARVNDAGTLPEVNDVNNGVGLTAATAFAKPFIDLSLGFASLPANFTPGKRASIGISVTNRGNTFANVRDVMNLLATVNGENIDGTEIDLGTARVSGRLKPGQSRIVKANVTPPATLLPGSTLTPRATLNVAGDTDPTNNTIFSSTPIAVV